jgi:hypothetical protein
MRQHLWVEQFQNGGSCHGKQGFWIQIDRHSKPTMNINSQHHNLLGKTNFAPIGGFCIWRPFYTLFTMATSAILKLFNP